MATTNKSLRQARTQKHDEFYTLYEDIAAERKRQIAPTFDLAGA